MQPVFLFPTAMEAAPLRALRPDLDVCICGVGVVETARYVARMLCEERPEQVLLCGIAGAYSEWEVGAVVQVTTERVAGLPAQYAAEYQASLRIDGVAEAVLLQPGAERQQLARVLLHTLVVAGKVCNQGCRKICLFRRDFPRDQYVAQGHECYNRYIRQESIL